MSSLVSSVHVDVYGAIDSGARYDALSSTTVDNVAGKVGYASRSHFSRAFHEQYGVSPVEFRKQYH